jgi:hypothetical protein
MTVDVKGTLESYLVNGGIKILPTIGDSFGTAIGSAIQNIFAGSVEVGGVTFALSGDTATAKVVGSGSAAPLLSEWDVAATFTAQGESVQLAFLANFQSSWALSNAWSVLQAYPFTSLTVSSGTVSLDVNPGDQSFELDISATASLDNSPIGTGLLVVSYSSGTLGFLGGFIVTGSWSPSAKWPVIGTLSLQGETGVFVSTITDKDLSAFKSLNLPYLPDEIDPGLTFIADMQLAGSLETLNSFFPSGTNLSLIANLPPAGVTEASVTATLTEPVANTAFNFQNFSLAWKSTSADSGEIDISITAVFNASSSDVLNLTGNGTFTYGPQPSLSADLTLSGSGSWTHPFGIPNLQIVSFSLGLSLSDEGIAIGAQGTIQIGTGAPAVDLTVGTAIIDFEAPSYIQAELAPASQGKSVTLAQLVTDFIPSLDLSNFPLLNDISFSELMFLAVAAPIELDGKKYSPGVGATGDISFFGYNLDFAFSVITQPSVAVQAKGSISEGTNKGPIVISAGGITILKLSDSTGTQGPSACIDTKGSGFCAGTIDSAYFTINAAMELLGLVSTSIVAEASSDSFEFDVSLDVASIFTEKMHCEFIPGKGDFAASLSTQFLPASLTLGPWGPIPQFTISTPSISLCVALGTVVPSAPVCGGYMPGGAPYFYLNASFSWGPIDFNIPIEVDFSTIATAFSDFTSWIKNLLLNSAKLVLNFLLETAEMLTKILYQIGWAIAEIAEAVAKQFLMALEDAFNLVTGVVDDIMKACGVESGNSALAPSASVESIRQQPRVLADLTTSPKGQELLYHYYLNREELDRFFDLRPGRPHSHLLAAYSTTEEYASHRHVPLVIDIVKIAAAQGSPQLRTSAEEMLPALEQYRGMTYAEFIAAINV